MSMKARTTKAKPRWQQATAEERIEILFSSAEHEFRQRPDRSRSYMELASKIAMRYNIRMPQNFKRKLCKECYMYLVPGESCKVRVAGGVRSVTCSCCGSVARYPLRPLGDSG